MEGVGKIRGTSRAEDSINSGRGRVNDEACRQRGSEIVSSVLDLTIN